MTHLVEVAFKGNRREFYLWEGESPPPVKAPVIVEADRGEDLGHVHSVGELATKRSVGTPHAPGPEGPARRLRRLASPDEAARERELRLLEDEARRTAMERVRANGLQMKLSDAEWQWDRKKLTFYFTAEKRVDFRTLVRELAAAFRTRIELKQIGVRDEARRLDGIGRCGRQYCSAAWLPELRPVNLGVAKDQRLSLNPSQISGACGRLMCSLRYEHEFYVQQRKRFPKESRIIRTLQGEEKVVANDIFRERVTLRRVDGEVRVVPLADLDAELAAVAQQLGIPSAVPRDHVDEPRDARRGAPDDEEHVEQEGSARTPPSRERRPPPQESRSLAPAPPAATQDPARPAAAGAVTPAAEDAALAERGEGERDGRPRRRGRRGGRRARGNRGGRGDGGAGSQGPQDGAASGSPAPND